MIDILATSLMVVNYDAFSAGIHKHFTIELGGTFMMMCDCEKVLSLQ